MNESALHELPRGWVWTKLGEVIAFEYGKGLTSDKRDQKGNVPVYGSNGIVGYHSIPLTEKPSIIIGRKGAAGYVHLSKVPCWAIDTTYYIIPPDELNLVFLYYLLSTLNLNSLDKSTAIPGLNRNDAYALKIPLPPFPEQRRIVTKLEELFTRLDAGVSELKKTQAQLKRYRQSVLKAACEGKLVPTEAELAKAEEREYEPADVLLARILKERREKSRGAKYKEHGAPDTNGLSKLPEGWSWANVGQMTDSMKNGIYKPSEFYNEDGFACLRMYNIDGGKIVWKDIKRMNLSKEEIGEFLLLPGDLLVNRVNSRELVGKAAVIPPGIERCVFESKNIRVRVLDEIVNPYYLCYRFTSIGTEYFNRNAQQVVGMASISQPQISRFPVPLPPLAEQRHIVSEVERRLSVADEVARTVEHSLAQAQRLRQSILKKAFEGRLVAQDANDEPAGVLLERIRQQKQIKEKNNKPTRRKIHG